MLRNALTTTNKTLYTTGEYKTKAIGVSKTAYTKYRCALRPHTAIHYVLRSRDGVERRDSVNEQCIIRSISAFSGVGIGSGAYLFLFVIPTSTIMLWMVMMLLLRKCE